MGEWMDGKKWAAKSRAETASAVASLRERGVVPGLTVVLVGDDPASQIYVRQKERMASQSGIASRVVRLPGNSSQEEVLALIAELNADPAVHGILVQLPLPAQIRSEAVMQSVLPEKDVDGFHPENVGRLSLGLPGPVPCTPLGVMRMLAYEGVLLTGLHAVVIGRSNIVGKPMAQLLLRADATVTVCHSRTRGIAEAVRSADLVVAAAGRPRFVTGDMVKPGAVVVDVGINRMDGRVVGDVDAESVFPVAGKLSPVPGGVGPMTIAMLLHNTVLAAETKTAG